MLIKTNSFELRADSIKLKGMPKIQIGEYSLNTHLTLKMLEEDTIFIVVPNSTGNLTISSKDDTKSFFLGKNEPADLTLKGNSLYLGTKDDNFNFTVSSDMKISFKASSKKIDTTSSDISAKILAFAKTPKTRYELFEHILTPDMYHHFAYGNSNNRSRLYQKYLWSLVDAGKLKMVGTTNRRYANLFQTV